MAAITATTNASILKTTYDAEFSGDPFEESKVAGFIARPVGSTAVGKELILRRVGNTTAYKWASTWGGGTGGIPSALTASDGGPSAVTVPLAYAYTMCELDEPALSRLVDDGSYRNELRRQMAGCVNAQIDKDIFDLASTLTQSESGADVNETLYLAAYGKLVKYGKNKVKVGQTDVRLFVNPDELKNVMAMAAAREYQIRGNAGTAATGKLVTTYGVTIEESGSITANGGSYYQPMIVKDAYAIGFNITPSALPEQQDGLVTRLIFRAEYAVAEWFDSSGVALITTA